MFQLLYISAESKINCKTNRDLTQGLIIMNIKNIR